MQTLHYKEREYRRSLAQKQGRPIRTTVLNRHHRNGLELHTVYDNGMVEVRNLHTNLLVTVLYARPSQLKRYFKNPPRWLVSIAQDNQKRGLNTL